MYISSINALCKGHISQELAPATLICGPHGSGKTSILDAIRISLDELSSVQEKARGTGETPAWAVATAVSDNEFDGRAGFSFGTTSEGVLRKPPTGLGLVVLNILDMGAQNAPRELAERFGWSEPKLSAPSAAQKVEWAELTKEIRDAKLLPSLAEYSRRLSSRRLAGSKRINELTAQLEAAKLRADASGAGTEALPGLLKQFEAAAGAQARRYYNAAVEELEAVEASAAALAATPVPVPPARESCTECGRPFPSALPEVSPQVQAQRDSFSARHLAALDQKAKYAKWKDAPDWAGPSLAVLKPQIEALQKEASEQEAQLKEVERIRGEIATATTKRDAQAECLKDVTEQLKKSAKGLKEIAEDEIRSWTGRAAWVDPVTGQWTIESLQGDPRDKNQLCGYERGLLDIATACAYSKFQHKILLLDDSELKGFAADEFVRLMEHLTALVAAGKLTQFVAVSAWCKPEAVQHIEGLKVVQYGI